MVIVKKRIDIDVSESEVRGCLVRGDGKVICQERLVAALSPRDLVNNVVRVINTLILRSSGYKFDIAGVNVSFAGKADEERGIVQAEEFGIKNLSLADSVADSVGLCVKVTEKHTAQP